MRTLPLAGSRPRTRPVRPRSIRSCTHCPYGRARRAVGGDQRSVSRRRQRVDRVHRGIAKTSPWRDAADGVANTRTSRPSSATARPPSGRQHSAVIGRSNRLTSAVAAPSRRRNAIAVGDVERLAVGREILGRVELPDRLGLFQDLVRLQRAVERRHRDGRVAASEPAVGEFLQRRDHLLFPQRRSYWTKFGSASPSL